VVSVLSGHSTTKVSALRQSSFRRCQGMALERGRADGWCVAMTEPSPFRYFRTSPEIIRLAVMMYVRFPLSLRNVEGR
jgi:hypothetical protein